MDLGSTAPDFGHASVESIYRKLRAQPPIGTPSGTRDRRAIDRQGIIRQHVIDFSASKADIRRWPLFYGLDHRYPPKNVLWWVAMQDVLTGLTVYRQGDNEELSAGLIDAVEQGINTALDHVAERLREAKIHPDLKIVLKAELNRITATALKSINTGFQDQAILRSEFEESHRMVSNALGISLATSIRQRSEGADESEDRPDFKVDESINPDADIKPSIDTVQGTIVYRGVTYKMKPGKSLELLKTLNENAGRWTSHDQLRDALWNSSTSNKTITAAVSRLRTELGSIELNQLANAISARTGMYMFKLR